MATFQDFSLIKKEVEFIKQDHEIEISSMAFIFTILEKLYPHIDVADHITDGVQDFSIDACYIDEINKSINIFQFKYTDKFDCAKKKQGIKEKDIHDLIVKMGRIWNKEDGLLKEASSKMSRSIENIWDAFGRGFATTQVWLITNYLNTIDKTKENNIRKTIKRDFKADLKIMSLDDLIKLIIEKESISVDIKLQLKGRNYFEDSAGEVRALIGEINASNFIKSITNNEEILIDGIFNENVRVYLKNNTKINKQIYESIKSEENYKFFFYNNGITAICDSFEHNKSDSPVVTLENFQIINGGQTIHSLYDAWKNGFQEKVDDIYLLLRIYEVKNRKIGQAIARFTNTQNPVRSRDIMSNDPTQFKLQQELLKEGFYYERKKYEFRDSDRDIENCKKIDAEKVGQAILSFYLEKPGSAKNKKQEIFGDYYNNIFSEDKINSNYVLVAYLIYKNIEKDIKFFNEKIRKLEKNKKYPQLKKVLQKDEFLNYASYYILFTLGVIAKEKKISIERKNINIIWKFYPKAKSILRDIVNKKKQDPKFSLPYLFKSDDLTKEINIEK